MKIMIFNFAVVLMIAHQVSAQHTTQTIDSTVTVQERLSNLKLNTRLHTAGMFNFSGRIASDNPAFDFTISYDRKTWGAMTFSAMDLIDRHSNNNFILSLLYKRIKLGKRVTVTPYTGFSIENWGKEKGDRQIIITAVKLNTKVSIDHTMLFPNVFAKHDHDWVNRLRMVYAVDSHIDIILSGWHNNDVFDNSAYISSALNVAYNRMRVSKYVMMNAGVTGLIMAKTTDEEIFPKKNGLLLTVGMAID